MKQKRVFVLAGPPGCGKSTWVRNNMTVGSEWVSRDNVRFAFLQPGDGYFDHETEVFDTFINYINQTLEKEEIHTVYIDATHVNKRSRDKVMRRIHMDNVKSVTCVCFDVPLETCYSRNNLRTGRSRVPQTAIYNMYQSYRIPEKGVENFDRIIIVDEDGNMKEV